jgi:hypothetical protein
MKQVKYISILCAAAMAVTFTACKKKKDPVTPPIDANVGTVKLEFSNKVGSESLVLNNNWYTNENGDSFTVSKFNYYISNIKLNEAGGSQFAEPESYHLLKQSDLSSMEFDIANVPNGTYKSVTFMIGVDSLRNVSGAQTGALAPGDMFWDWNTGYIMLKFEGNSPMSTQPDDIVQLHMGGFSGTNSVLRTVTLAFPQDLVVNDNEPHVHLAANVLELFKSPTTISFATLNAVHMFSVTLVGN